MEKKDRRLAESFLKGLGSGLLLWDKDDWAEVVRRAQESTGLDVTLETFDDFTQKEHERFGRACNKAQSAMRRKRHKKLDKGREIVKAELLRRSRKSPEVT